MRKRHGIDGDIGHVNHKRGAKVVVNRAIGHPSGPGDIPHRRSMKPLRGKYLRGPIQNLVTSRRHPLRFDFVYIRHSECSFIQLNEYSFIIVNKTLAVSSQTFSPLNKASAS